MVSLRQKRYNDVMKEDLTSDDSDCDYSQNYSFKRRNDDQNTNSIKKTKLYTFSSPDYERKLSETRRQKCFSKNALMARENRIKKKLYVQNLEESMEKYKDENKKLSSILDNQSTVISDLRKEVKYLKNVLANSSDIGRLLKCINQNTGLPVATSLNNNSFNSKLHPWEDEKMKDIKLEELNGEFSTLFDIESDSKWNDLFSDLLEKEELPKENLQLNEHNYTLNDLDEDVGVCLHVAKHRVSLEFCSSCSVNASTAWNEDS